MRVSTCGFRHLTLVALSITSAACATTGGTPRPFPGARVTVAPPVTAKAADTPVAPGPADPLASLIDRRFDGRAVAQFALGFRGVPYRLGGSDPAGFDCSGLVQYVFAQYGIDVPRVVEDQYDVGKKVRPSDIKPGDLMFFNTKNRGSGASHVAIAIGRDSFVHAPNSTGVVRVETLASTYWGARYLGARRVSPANP